MKSKNLFKPLVDMNQPVFDRFDNSSAGVSFTGIGAALDQSNQFVFPILRAESTTVSGKIDANGNLKTARTSGE